MKLECEDKSPVEDVKPAQIKKTVSRLKSYGPCSFASLTDSEGNYVQVAGGRVTCMIERRDVSAGRHFRAYQNIRSEVFADGTMLVFGGGKIHLSSDEWFTASDAEEVFMAFLDGAEMPERIMWRDISEIFNIGG